MFSTMTTKNVLMKSLQAMDSAYKWYTNEDEANRELTTSLLVLGHDAAYHYQLDYAGKRIADVFSMNSIIEGKLKPNQSDIDRLTGQVNDYLKTPYPINIVIYGKINFRELAKVQQLVDAHRNRVSLVYLTNPKRDRAEKETAENKTIEVQPTNTKWLDFLPNSRLQHATCEICDNPTSYRRWGKDLCLNCINKILINA